MIQTLIDELVLAGLKLDEFAEYADTLPEIPK